MSFAAPSLLVWLAGALLTVSTLWIAAGVIAAPLSGIRRGAVVVANALAALALFALLVQPSFPPGAGQSVVLLTPPAQAGPSLLASQETVQLEGLDLYPLFEQVARPRVVQVQGAGLPLSSWPREGMTLEPRLAPLPPGPTELKWPRRLAWGQELEVSGRVVGYDNAEIGLTLEYEGVQTAESALTQGRFSLRDVPRFAGRHQYALVARGESGNEVFREVVPVEVLQPPGLRILMMLSAPSYEATALQRWLAHSADGLRSETAVAPDVRREQVLGEAPELRAWLEQPDSVDLLITDPGWLNARSQSESERLRSAVSAGLGVLVLADDSLLRQVPLLLQGWRWGPADSFEATVASEGAVRAAPVAVQNAAALAQSDDGRPLVLAAPPGAGRIAVSLINDSHTLQRRSGAEVYARLWQPVIAATARENRQSLWVQAPLPATLVGEWVWLCRLDGCQRRVLNKAGWQRLAWDEDEVWVFAHGRGDFSTWRADALAQDTRKAARLMREPADAAAAVDPFEPAGWLLIFLLSAAFLWLEQRAR